MIQDIEKIDFIHEVKFNSNEPRKISFQADSDRIQDVVSYLSNAHIIKLESNPQTLESLFLHHYTLENQEEKK